MKLLLRENKMLAKKKIKLALACLILLNLVAVAVAAYWVYSNIVTVTVSAYSFQESLTVDDTTPTQYQNITFTGTLYYGGNPVGAGYNITLFRNDVPVAWNLTDSNGNFAIVYNCTDTGTFNFTAGYQVP